ncbi:MAG: FHA domain-containing protein [Planctomycetota bacterium]
MPELVVRVSGEESARLALGSRSLTIGRAPSCDVVLDFPFISKRHVQIEPQVIIHDLGSSNGVWLDDQPIDSRPARPRQRYSVSRHQGVELEILFADDESAPSGGGELTGATTSGLEQPDLRDELRRMREEVERLSEQNHRLEAELAAQKAAAARGEGRVSRPMSAPHESDDPEATFVHRPIDPETTDVDDDPEATFVHRPSDPESTDPGDDPEATFIHRTSDAGSKPPGDDPEATFIHSPDPDDPEATFMSAPPRREHEAEVEERQRKSDLLVASLEAKITALRSELVKVELRGERQLQELEQLRRRGSAPIGDPDANLMSQLLVALEDAEERNRIPESVIGRPGLAEDVVFVVSRFYLFGRAIEKVTTRMAQQFRSRLAGDMTMLPGMHTNWRRSLRRLLEKGEETAREDLDAYLEELRLWVLACFSAYPKGAASWLEQLLGRIAPRVIERDVEAASWRKKLGWDATQYWAKYRELMEEYSADLCVDQLEEIAAQEAVKLAES